MIGPNNKELPRIPYKPPSEPRRNPKGWYAILGMGIGAGIYIYIELLWYAARDEWLSNTAHGLYFWICAICLTISFLISAAWLENWKNRR